jgi:hypothetical protein
MFKVLGDRWQAADPPSSWVVDGGCLVFLLLETMRSLSHSLVGVSVVMVFVNRRQP